jgi:hypothetical protein
MTTNADRELVLAAVRGLLNESALIITTRGTDTMVPIGLFLGERACTSTIGLGIHIYLRPCSISERNQVRSAVPFDI